MKKPKEFFEDFYKRCAEDIKTDIANGVTSEESFWKVRRLAMYAINYLRIREEL